MAKGQQIVTSLGALAAALALTSAASAEDHAPRPVTSYHAPRAADGHPDLQGVWTSATVTRLERNPRWSKTLALTDEETRKIEGQVKAQIDLGNKPTDPNAKVTDLPADCSGG